jgi:hypothetical protein
LASRLVTTCAKVAAGASTDNSSRDVFIGHNSNRKVSESYCLFLRGGVV